MQPTESEINVEIAKLKEMKPTVRRQSAFGDDHYAAIDAQIKTLEKRYDLNDVDDKYEDGPSNVYDSARDAVDWMKGDSENTPSEEWESLLIK